jgi:RNA polymerase sigma-70 factor (ECF subfamily)
LLGNSGAAEDLAQEAFLRLWRSGPQFAGPEDAARVVAWLYRTSLRLAIDMARDSRRAPLLDVDDPPATCGVDNEKALEARSALSRLASVLPRDEIEAAALCRIDGLTHIEAAEAMGISERSLRRLLARFDEHVAAMRTEITP